MARRLGPGGKLFGQRLRSGALFCPYLVFNRNYSKFATEQRRITTLKTGKIQEHIVYGFTSLRRDEIGPRRLLDAIQAYWGIENGLHYRRDVTLKEDRIRMTKGKTGQVMACINNLVLGLLIGKHKFRYLPQARRFFAAQPERAFALISRL